jgi:hypothetical protein
VIFEVKKGADEWNNDGKNKLRRFKIIAILRVVCVVLSIIFLTFARFFSRNREGNGVLLGWISSILSLIFGVLGVFLEKVLRSEI